MTAFDEVSSHLTTWSSDLNRLQQLYSEQYAPFSSCGLEQQTVARDGVQGCSVPRHSPHHFDNQQSEVSLLYLGKHHTHETLTAVSRSTLPHAEHFLVSPSPILHFVDHFAPMRLFSDRIDVGPFV
jgi:hypothetical protein